MKAWLFGLLFMVGSIGTLFLAFLIRFDFRWETVANDTWLTLYFLPALPIALIAKLAAGILFGLITARVRKTVWALVIALATALVATMLFFLGIYANYAIADAAHYEPFISPSFPRSVFMLDFFLAALLAGFIVLMSRVRRSL